MDVNETGARAVTTTDWTTSGIEDPRERLVQWASLYRKTIPGTYRWLVNAGARQTPAQRCEATRLRAAKVPETVGDPVWDGLLAATTEYACETVGIAPPAWCKTKAFKGPDEPWYAEEETERALGLNGGDIEEEMRERHLADTPECFRRRNLVINPESLSLLRGG